MMKKSPQIMYQGRGQKKIVEEVKNTNRDILIDTYFEKSKVQKPYNVLCYNQLLLNLISHVIRILAQ